AIDAWGGATGVAGSDTGAYVDISGVAGDGAGGYGGSEVGTAGVAGQIVNRSGLAQYLCGEVPGKTSAQGFAKTNIVNGQSYAVALAVSDNYGNLGTLSKYQCAKARPVTTFFEAYRYAGGEAGGGFCNLGAVPKRTSIPVTLGVLGVCAWLRRRHRRARPNAPQAND
ncbi:MAG TPA: hypothetical protein VKP30_14905, partial [Polyangiaceae bacterium]|nr:hypothetical protein [Polyangiaceae bacterium]